MKAISQPLFSPTPQFLKGEGWAPPPALQLSSNYAGLQCFVSPLTSQFSMFLVPLLPENMFVHTSSDANIFQIILNSTGPAIMSMYSSSQGGSLCVCWTKIPATYKMAAATVPMTDTVLSEAAGVATEVSQLQPTYYVLFPLCHISCGKHCGRMSED